MESSISSFRNSSSTLKIESQKLALYSFCGAELDENASWISNLKDSFCTKLKIESLRLDFLMDGKSKLEGAEKQRTEEIEEQRNKSGRKNKKKRGRRPDHAGRRRLKSERLRLDGRRK